MRIEFGKYVLTSDPYNLILAEKKVVKKGKSKGEEYTDTVGFYANIYEVAHALTELRIKGSDAVAVSGLLDVVREVKTDVTATINRECEKCRECKEGRI